jgi:hypothetical protein
MEKPPRRKAPMPTVRREDEEFYAPKKGLLHHVKISGRKVWRRALAEYHGKPNSGRQARKLRKQLRRARKAGHQ